MYNVYFSRVEQVIEGSPAYKGGLRNHDLILRFGTVTKDNFNDNLAMISNMLSGYQVRMRNLSLFLSGVHSIQFTEKLDQ